MVIGGGFFGLSVALELGRQGKRALILEAHSEPMTRASMLNQARVHGGYHYPRHLNTALRSRINRPHFEKIYREAIYDRFTHVYAIAKEQSLVSGRQFKNTMDLMGSELKPASAKIRGLFDPQKIDVVYEVQEPAFDALKLRELILRDLQNFPGLRLLTNTRFDGLQRTEQGLSAQFRDAQDQLHQAWTRRIYNCTYAALSANQQLAGLPVTPIQFELAELCLVQVPSELQELGVTVMCGPFFSVMPFPMKTGFHSLSHVRWTPHFAWTGNPRQFQERPASNYQHMVRDASKYLPILEQAKFSESLFEVKAILPKSEQNDGRPILYQKQLDGDWINILGGKLDNVFDVFEFMKQDI